jgi:hypothetical protein
MRISGAHRDDDVITFFHPITGKANAELHPRTVIAAHTVLAFMIGRVEEHAGHRFQRVHVTLLCGQRLDFNVQTSANGHDYDLGLITLVAELLTAAIR